MKQEIFTGVCTALVTPFRDGVVDIDKLKQLLDFQIEHCVDAVCICGTTGEASTLSQDEKMKIVTCTVEHCAGKIKVIAGTGSNCTAQAVADTRLVSSTGVDAVLVVTPYYNKATPQGLIDHYSAISDVAACPVILYNVPSRTAVDIPLQVYCKLSGIENIVGVKEASGDLAKAARILAECGEKFSVWSGNDDAIVPMMSIGGSGVISVLSNLCPSQTVSMVNFCQSGDYQSAGHLQCAYMDLIDALFCEVNPIPIKEAMNMAGFSVGSPRLPLCHMCQPNKEHLHQLLVKHSIAAE